MSLTTFARPAHVCYFVCSCVRACVCVCYCACIQLGICMVFLNYVATSMLHGVNLHQLSETNWVSVMTLPFAVHTRAISQPPLVLHFAEHNSRCDLKHA
jgi:hypothetical protein